MENTTMPIDKMYSHRRDFIVVALTGITGSGCSDLAKIMSEPFPEWQDKIRNPRNSFAITYESSKQDVVFKRKYDACYNVCQKQYKSFKILRYRNVLLLATLEKFATANTYKMFLIRVSELLRNKFDKSHKDNNADYKVDNLFTEEDLNNIGLNEELFNLFKSLSDTHNTQNRERFSYRKELCSVYFNESFQSFCEALYNELKRRDYYAKNFFVHRLANSIRATGNPDATVNQNNEYGCEHIFDVIELINEFTLKSRQADL